MRLRAVGRWSQVVAQVRAAPAAAGLVALGLVVTSLGVGTAVARAGDHPAPTAPVASAPDDPQAGDALTSGITVPGATPVPLAPVDDHAAAAIAIHVPRLKIDRDLVGLRVQTDRSLTVPESFDDVGWWSGGPHPGGPGATLFAGHVSSRSGPGVFYRLKDLRVGDPITVDRADQTTAVFRVVGRASYPRSAFPDEVVYRITGKPSIHLVTCDGPFDSRIGHHEDNLVVFADLVSTRPTKGTR
ncbi:class F sortase [Angustibacter peucedani]